MNDDQKGTGAASSTPSGSTAGGSTTPPTSTATPPATPGGSDDVVSIPRGDLQKILESQAKLEKDREDDRLRMAGLEQMLADTKGPEALGGIRERKSNEPTFRTVRLHKFPMFGNENDVGIVIGWTNKGAYQIVDRSGVSPVTVDMIDVLYLGRERNAEGKLQAEQIPLLTFLNSPTIVCKVVDTKKEARKEPTGEEIDVTTWDNARGVNVPTGDKIDGYVGYTDVTFTVQIPGYEKPVEVDELFVN